MNIAIITFSKQGLVIANALKNVYLNCTIYIHSCIISANSDIIFDHINDIIGSIFSTYRGIIFIGPCGIAVRSISSHVHNKLSDPAVVVIDACGRFVISLLSGHEGGANDLAIETANIIGAEPCVSTTTEAVKLITAGIGCRKGISSQIIIEAIQDACLIASITLQQIRSIATAQIKSSEKGLLDACKTLGLPLRIIPDWQIQRCGTDITRSEFVEKTTGLPGVAEPAALVSGRNTVLILKKHVYQGVTIALAKENCLWSELDQATLLTEQSVPNKQ